MCTYVPLVLGRLMSKYKHLLWDIDGTLIDTYMANIVSIIELLDKYQPGHGYKVENLSFLFGLPGRDALRALNVPEEQMAQLMAEWEGLVRARCDMCKVFDGIIPVLEFLQAQGYHMAIVTSRTRDANMGGPLGGYLPEPFIPYIERCVCAGDTKRPKPFPDPFLHYMEITGARREEVLYIGDTATDLQAANAAGVDFALALWGYRGKQFLRCAHYVRSPWEVVSVVTAKEPDSSVAGQLHRWAREINAIGQNGLAYVKDVFDEERYQRLCDVAAEMASCYIDADVELIRKEWVVDGYKTPQVDTRAAIFDEQGRILMVKEKRTGKWNLPGGWCDENLSIVQNTLKEVREEASMEATALRLIAVHDRNRHNSPDTICGCLKVFIECAAAPNSFGANSETAERRYFSQDEIAHLDLRTTTCSLDQIAMCFACHQDPNWRTVIE